MNPLCLTILPWRRYPGIVPTPKLRSLSIVIALILGVCACAPRPAVTTDILPQVVSDAPAESSDVYSDVAVSEGPGARVFIAWPVLRHEPYLTAALRDWAQAQARVFLAAHQVPGSEIAELNGTWSYLVQTKRMVGIRLTLQSRVEGQTQNWSKTFYGDADGSLALAGSDFFPADKRKLVQELVLAGARSHGISINDDALHDPALATTLLDDLTIDKTGAITVRVGQGAILGPASAPVLVTLPAATIADLLTAEVANVMTAVQTQVVPATIPPVKTVPKSTATTSAKSVDCAQVKCVALTFDGGPVPGTAELSALLKSKGSVGTFFLAGAFAAANPGAVKHLADSGMSIATFGMDGRSFAGLSAAEQTASISQAADQIEATGAPRPEIIRAPYGVFPEGAATAGLPVVLWDVDAHDVTPADTEFMAKTVLDSVKPGSIIRFHDASPATHEQLEQIIEGLRAKGYVFVTAQELCAGQQICHRRG